MLEFYHIHTKIRRRFLFQNFSQNQNQFGDSPGSSPRSETLSQTLTMAIARTGVYVDDYLECM